MFAETKHPIISTMAVMHKCAIPAELSFDDVSKRRRFPWRFNAIATLSELEVVKSGLKPDHFAGLSLTLNIDLVDLNFDIGISVFVDIKNAVQLE